MGGVTHEKSVYGPIEWVLRDSSMKLQAAISQAMQLQLSGNFRSVEDLYSLIFKDLNPQVFTLENMDKRRITARQFGFMSSLSILSIKGLKD